MPTLRELKGAIDSGAIIVEKDTDERESMIVDWEDNFYTLMLPARVIESVRGRDMFARANWAVAQSCGYVDFDDLLADLGEIASIDNWRIAAPSYFLAFPEGWPEHLVQAHEGHKKAWKGQIIGDEWKQESED